MTTPLRLLFVEDNDDLREAIGLMLEGDGRSISAFGTAEEALAAFEQAPFDVLVTDVSLPSMSGTELARRVLQRAPGTWVVLASGYDLRQGVETLGPTARALPKPFEIEQLDALLEEIATALGKRSSS